MKKKQFYLLAILAIFINISCNNSSKETDQQKQIDSLNNVIKQRDDSSAKEKEVKQIQEKGSKAERNSIISKIYTDKPSFTPLSLGGFKDIRFNLFNDSKYNLDQVIFKVHYIKANGVEVKEETKILNNIAPNSHTALTAPDYIPAGKEIKVTIETVLCKAINLCYYYSPIDSVASSDPYKCR